MADFSVIAQNKTGPEAGPYLVAARTFIPELTIAPDRSLSSLGAEYKDFCLDNFGRIASCQSVYQTGFAAGQIDPNYIMFYADMVNRPNIEMKIGLTQPPLLGVLENPNRVMASGNTSGGSLDLLVAGSIKGNQMGRFTEDSATYSVQPPVSNSPFAKQFALAASGNVAKLQQTQPLDSLMSLSGMGGGQRTCGQVPLMASVAPENEYWTYGTDYKFTPMDPTIILPGNGMATLDSAYNKLVSTRQLGSSGSVSKGGEFA